MIDSTCFDVLQRIGLKPSLIHAALLATRFDGAEQLVRISRVERDQLAVHDGHAEFPARALPALLTQLLDQGDSLAVGDWVLAWRNTLGETWVHERLPPLTQLARRLHDGREKVTRVAIVNNVDTALLTMGADLDFNPRRLQRYLALAHISGVAPVVVLTKADLCADLPARQRELAATLPAGVPCVAVNALHDSARAALEPWLAAGQTLVLLGSSGAGKSTLTNTLLGAAVQRTGEARRGDGRGRHTTTARSLHVTPHGACIIDTPGLRTLRLDADEAALDEVFDDIGALAQHCRYRDCRHDDEPGCAVREGVSTERLRSYHKLRREAGRDTLSLRQRQERLALWKSRARHSRLRMAAKRG